MLGINHTGGTGGAAYPWNEPRAGKGIAGFLTCVIAPALRMRGGGERASLPANISGTGG